MIKDPHLNMCAELLMWVCWACMSSPCCSLRLFYVKVQFNMPSLHLLRHSRSYNKAGSLTSLECCGFFFSPKSRLEIWTKTLSHLRSCRIMGATISDESLWAFLTSEQQHTLKLTYLLYFWLQLYAEGNVGVAGPLLPLLQPDTLFFLYALSPCPALA